VERLRGVAEERGCYGMWAVTDEHNREALDTNMSSGATPERGQVVFDWTS